MFVTVCWTVSKNSITLLLLLSTTYCKTQTDHIKRCLLYKIKLLADCKNAKH
jgi:hypothetical protein